MSNLLQPKVLMSIKDLQLAAKTTIDGFMAGINKSNVKGTGLEFSQYRSYQPGDDLRWLDWKMFARSDRYYIRESEIETSISVKILIDASNSMKHSCDGVSKIDYARYAAAALGYLANLQGDAIGLYVFHENDLFSLASRKDPQHITRFYHELENLQPAGKFTRAIHYKHLFAGEQKKELLIFMTDFYERDGEISKLLDVLSALHHEIIVFHLAAENELNFDFGGYTTLQDLETGETININSARQKNEYIEKMNNHLADLRMQQLEKHIYYSLININQPMEKVLRDFLQQRQKMFI
ncbi:DUF58 domain-containing protein [Danxiaibacter flavus]|uniref:DUF58 domain-containing protein n=1 Tax=Danxiaibacter flavus TaxID=3049108 RepID=A0ABV3ZLX9_9BACT|nr:DUF58 domain-containing protein [Chitinophagaceae bacterium DXS]